MTRVDQDPVPNTLQTDSPKSMADKKTKPAMKAGMELLKLQSYQRPVLHSLHAFILHLQVLPTCKGASPKHKPKAMKLQAKKNQKGTGKKPARTPRRLPGCQPWMPWSTRPSSSAKPRTVAAGFGSARSESSAHGVANHGGNLQCKEAFKW